MMMQMLQAGGLTLLTDQVRPANADNPAGYFEYEPVKRLRVDSSWLKGAQGKAIKVVSPLLYALPTDIEYRVLFMQRPLDQVLASQRAMLKGQGIADDPVGDRTLRAHFEGHLQELSDWLARQSHLVVLEVPYLAVVQDPGKYARRIASFARLNGDLDKIAQVVREDLLRQRI